MIAIDTSSMARALDGILDSDTRAVREAVQTRVGYFPPIVLTELLSNPLLADEARVELLQIPLLEIREGYWQRAGMLRLDLRSRGLKAKLADVLVAQSCIDHDVPLITYDRDFRHFSRAGLKLR